MIDKWRIRFNKGGVCDFKKNYNFFFKWLTNKVCECIVVDGLPDSINKAYLKTNLILDGNICITEFGDKLYACIGGLGGQPDEYYVPTIYTIANPILGSKQVNIGKDGIVIYNTDMDSLSDFDFCGGLYDLISQTATLLADNIISINCAQINTRVTAVFTADSDGQALAGEAILKKMYAGSPYQILRQDIVKKIGINPMAQNRSNGTITELVELQNYIIANFFQSIGIKSNSIRKKDTMIRDEINSQNEFIAISIMEILQSWQKGFDKVNEMYGTDIHVSLNPVLSNSFLQDIGIVEDPEPEVHNQFTDENELANNEESQDTEQIQQITEDETDVETVETVEETESVADQIEDAKETIQEIIDEVNDTEGGDEEDVNSGDTVNMEYEESESVGDNDVDN